MRRNGARKLIILAAGEGTRLRPYTLDLPKCLVEVQGKSLLAWQVGLARSVGITEIVVVKGYLGEKIDIPAVRFYTNEAYDATNMVASLWCARRELEGEVIVSYGDILYEEEVLTAVIRSPHDISVAVDKGWRAYWEKRFDDPLADAESLRVDRAGRISSIGQRVADVAEIHGQFIGLIKFRGAGVNTLRGACLKAAEASGRGDRPFRCNRTFERLFMTDLLQGLVDEGHAIYEVPIRRKWLEIDSTSDYRLAQEITKVSGASLEITDACNPEELT